MSYDAILIGAGPSGLAAAARLSHFGIKVCLLDGHTRLGGLNSWHHVRGREISSGLHAFTNYNDGAAKGPLGKLCRQLRLKPADLDLRPQRQSSIRFPGVVLAFSNDPGLVRSQVAEAFPDQIDGFDRFRELVRRTDEGEITERQTSARAVMEEYIASPLLRDMLFCPVMFYGNPGGVGDGRDSPRRTPDMDWLLFCVVWKCIFESGFAHPVHGMRPLWELLARRIADNGGDIRLGSRVKSLRRDGDRVVAAVLEDGAEISGGLFFSSAGGEETGRLLNPGESSPGFPVGSVSIVEGIRVLDSDAPALGLDDTAVFYSFSERFAFHRPESLYGSSNGVVCAPGNYEGVEDNVLKVTFLASHPRWRELSPDAYQSAKTETGRAMAAALEKLGLDLTPEKSRSGRYDFFDDLFTPLTLERFTAHTEGALYGSPVKSRSGATACSNLFLMGTDQGFHGIVGAMLSGVAMANAHCLSKQG